MPEKRKKLPVRKEFDYNPIGSFRMINPYDVAFCYSYPLYDRPFVVKGGLKDVRKYLKKQKTPMIVHHTFYRHGKPRRSIEFIGFGDNEIYIERRWKNANVSRYSLVAYIKRDWAWHQKVEKRVLATFKRVPRRWIRELNILIPNNRRF